MSDPEETVAWYEATEREEKIQSVLDLHRELNNKTASLIRKLKEGAAHEKITLEHGRQPEVNADNDELDVLIQELKVRLQLVYAAIDAYHGKPAEPDTDEERATPTTAKRSFWNWLADTFSGDTTGDQN